MPSDDFFSYKFTERNLMYKSKHPQCETVIITYLQEIYFDQETGAVALLIRLHVHRIP